MTPPPKRLPVSPGWRWDVRFFWLILHIPAVLGSSGVGEIVLQKNSVYGASVTAEPNRTL